MKRVLAVAVFLASGAGVVAACTSFHSQANAADAGSDAAPSTDAVSGDDDTDAADSSPRPDADTSCNLGVDGAVAYWPLDETSGPSARECIAAVNGILTGDVTWLAATDSKGPGLSFDGDGGTLAIPNATKLQFGDVPFTLSLWTSVASAQLDPIGTWFSRSQLNRNWFFGVHAGPPRPSVFGTFFLVSSDNAIGPDLSFDVWTHVAAVFVPQGSITTYVDGIAKDVFSIMDAGPMLTDPSALLTIGENPAGDSRFSGLMRRIALFDRALTAAEVLTLSKN